MTGFTFYLLGAVSGAFSAVIITIFQRFVLDGSWFAIVLLLPSISLRGLIIAWGYDQVAGSFSPQSWIKYSATLILFFCILLPTAIYTSEPETLPINPDLQGFLSAKRLLTRVTRGIILNTAAIHLWLRLGWHRVWATLLTITTLLLLAAVEISTFGLRHLPGSLESAYYKIIVVLTFLGFLYASGVIILSKMKIFQTLDD